MVIKFTLNGKDFRAQDYSVTLQTESNKLGHCMPREIRVRLSLDPTRNAGAEIMKFASNQMADAKKMKGSIDVFNGTEDKPSGEAIEQVMFSDGFVVSANQSVSKHDDHLGLDVVLKAHEVTISGEKFQIPKAGK